ncbi:hypothetical protein ACF0H5_001649 [Mactra antiquata]
MDSKLRFANVKRKITCQNSLKNGSKNRNYPMWMLLIVFRLDERYALIGRLKGHLNVTPCTMSRDPMTAVLGYLFTEIVAITNSLCNALYILYMIINYCFSYNVFFCCICAAIMF